MVEPLHRIDFCPYQDSQVRPYIELAEEEWHALNTFSRRIDYRAAARTVLPSNEVVDRYKAEIHIF